MRALSVCLSVCLSAVAGHELRAQAVPWSPGFNHPNPDQIPGCGGVTQNNLFNPLHGSLIPTGEHRGKVLVWDASGNAACASGSPLKRDQRWAIVDPEAQQFIHLGVFTVQPGWAPPRQGQQPHGNHNLFCAGHAWMPDGRLLTMGGDDWSGPVPGATGSRLVMTYDPSVGTGTWQNRPSLQHARWYPSLLHIARPGLEPNRRFLVMGGVDVFTLTPPTDVPRETFEVWNAATLQFDMTVGSRGIGLWNAFLADTAILHDLFFYPRVHMISENALGGSPGNCRVFTSGFDIETTHIDHFSAPGVWPTLPHPVQQGILPAVPAQPKRNVYRAEGASVLFPNLSPTYRDQIMVLGGELLHQVPTQAYQSLGVTNGVQILDAKSANPQWQPLQPMHRPRKSPNVVLLPDGTVGVFGGSSAVGYPNHDPDIPELCPEFYKNGSWTLGPPQVSPRTYHSIALLLPSGRVLTAGGESRRNLGGWDYEVYSPDYMWITPRPQWDPGVATTLTYGSSYSLPYGGLDFSMYISRVVLIAPGSVTHSQDPNQRYVQLDLAMFQAEGSVSVIAPANETYAPPGYYMMFAVANNGAVSDATWVALQ